MSIRTSPEATRIKDKMASRTMIATIREKTNPSSVWERLHAQYLAFFDNVKPWKAPDTPNCASITLTQLQITFYQP
jgi:hypothetical protein